MDSRSGSPAILRARDIDPDGVKVVKKLIAAGHEAYFVGGCVRDLYLKRKPKDFDVATSATPEQIRRLFRNSRIIGRRFRLVHVYFGSKVIETSTFRSPPIASQSDPLITQDNEWGTIEDDARRRDFTVNALFYSVENGEIVDFVDGLSDLDTGVIRTIGDPEVRFREDPVRMMRAIKFAARLDFHIEEQSWEALLRCAPDIAKCSRARVLEEVLKLMRGGAARRSFEMLLVTKMFHSIWQPYLDLFEAQGGLQYPGYRDEPGGAGALLMEYLDALDSYVTETQQTVGNGILQAVLFAPLLTDETLNGPRPELEQSIDRSMNEPCAFLGVARRDRELARQIIMSHRHMSQPNRRRSRTSLVQRQYFHDALVFLGLSVEARGDDGTQLDRWQSMAQTQREESNAGPSSRKRHNRKRRSRSRSTPRQGTRGHRSNRGDPPDRPGNSS